MILNEADFNSAVYDLIDYVTAYDSNVIYRGNQSREVKPPDNNYCVFTPITRKRVGTNIMQYDAAGKLDTENGDYSDIVLVTMDIQVDCYGEYADNEAQKLETFCQSLLCNSWLDYNNAGIRVFYTSSPVDATYIDDTKQYNKRYIITLSICFSAEISNGVPWFDDVRIKGTHIDPDTGHLTPASEAGVVNVDVYFKP
jgi:hypothetical protein